MLSIVAASLTTDVNIHAGPTGKSRTDKSQPIPVDLTMDHSVIDLTAPTIPESNQPTLPSVNSLASQGGRGPSPSEDTSPTSASATKSSQPGAGDADSNGGGLQESQGRMDVDGLQPPPPPNMGKGKKRVCDPVSPRATRRTKRPTPTAAKATTPSIPVKDPSLRSTWVIDGLDEDLTDKDLGKM